MNKPRIYLVIDTFLPLVGGAEKQALLQGCQLRDRGYSATILTMRYNQTWSRHETIDGIPILRVGGFFLSLRHRLPAPIRQGAYFLALLTLLCLLWQHRRRYDIVHVYQLGLLVLPTLLVSHLIHKPLLVSVRCADAGSLSTTSTSSRQHLSGDLASLKRLGKPFVSLTGAALAYTRTPIIVLSSRMQAYLASHRIPTICVAHIPNGVDTTRFAPIPSELRATERASTVICVSKLRHQKGIDVLLRAWTLVILQAPTARLLIVGDGPLEVDYHHLTHCLDITASVTFVGFQADIALWLHQANIAVLSSRWEGMPNSLLEAMACGMACVATRVSGSEDLIQSEVNGLLVEPENHAELAAALLRLLSQPELATRFGQAARAHIEEHYSLEKMLDRYLTLYQKMLTC